MLKNPIDNLLNLIVVLRTHRSEVTELKTHIFMSANDLKWEISQIDVHRNQAGKTTRTIYGKTLFEIWNCLDAARLRAMDAATELEAAAGNLIAATALYYATLDTEEDLPA